MKFHLPKKLLVAVLATMSVQSTLAGYLNIGGIIGVDANGNPETKIIAPSYIPAADTSVPNAPIAKDGSGTLTINEDGDINNDLFVREGKLVIQDASIYSGMVSSRDTGLTHGTAWPEGKGNAIVRIGVGGKDAVMEVNNSTYELYMSQIHLNIGGMNGNGKLVFDNSKLKNRYGYCTSIGIHTYLDETDILHQGCHVVHATTKTPEAGSNKSIENRYEGTYANASMDSSIKVGRGEVVVTHGSDVNFGSYGSLFLGEAILTIEDGSRGEIGAYMDDNSGESCGKMPSYFGAQSGTLSIVNIKDNSELDLKYTTKKTDDFTLLYTGEDKMGRAVENSGTVINVEDNSKLLVARGVELSTNDANTTTTVLSLTNDSVAKFGSLTAGSESGNSTAEINIDATSSVEAYDPAKDLQVTINHASVNNAGTIDASTVDINNGGILSMIGKDAKLNDDSVVTVNEGGTLQVEGGEAIALNAKEVTVNEGGAISLKNGSTLSAKALTMAAGSTIKLSGNYSSGDKLVSSDTLDMDGVTVTMDNGQIEYTIENGVVYLTAVFDNSIAEALTVTNWGIATASRTFVNAVRGQRSNTGCIANGRGTAWAAVLGGTSDIGNGDIDLKGAAVGADMKVGEKSSVGVAVGYIDGDARIPGMSKAEQEGTYVALYGEHGLKKLSDTSCLSLDWVAAYGQTETEWESADWEQQSLQLNTRLNWNKKVTDRLCMSVFGGLEYFTSESDLVENAKTGSIQNLRGEIGVGARYVAWGTPGTAASYDEKGALVTASRPGCEKLVLHGEIRYMNDLVRSNPVIEQDGLRGDGENPGRQGMGIEAGATYRIGERWSASANYGFNTMDDSREHRVNVGASYTF